MKTSSFRRLPGPSDRPRNSGSKGGAGGEGGGRVGSPNRRSPVSRRRARRGRGPGTRAPRPCRRLTAEPSRRPPSRPGPGIARQRQRPFHAGFARVVRGGRPAAAILRGCRKWAWIRSNRGEGSCRRWSPAGRGSWRSPNGCSATWPEGARRHRICSSTAPAGTERRPSCWRSSDGRGSAECASRICRSTLSPIRSGSSEFSGSDLGGSEESPPEAGLPGREIPPLRTPRRRTRARSWPVGSGVTQTDRSSSCWTKSTPCRRRWGGRSSPERGGRSRAQRRSRFSRRGSRTRPAAFARRACPTEADSGSFRWAGWRDPTPWRRSPSRRENRGVR